MYIILLWGRRFMHIDFNFLYCEFAIMFKHCSMNKGHCKIYSVCLSMTFIHDMWSLWRHRRKKHCIVDLLTQWRNIYVSQACSKSKGLTVVSQKDFNDICRFFFTRHNSRLVDLVKEYLGSRPTHAKSTTLSRALILDPIPHDIRRCPSHPI